MGRRLIPALVVALVLLGGGGSANAATLKANYQLQGDLASVVGGAPSLTDLGPGNRFIRETVDGVSRQVLRFPKGGGLALSTSGLVDPRSYSVVLLFRLDELNRFRRILDFSTAPPTTASTTTAATLSSTAAPAGPPAAGSSSTSPMPR